VTGSDWPSYLSLAQSGELARRAQVAREMMRACSVCPRECGVDRLAGERGFCRQGAAPVVASWNRHLWEEPPISGTRGSGTIFFSGCVGRCLFCQNWPISQLGHGQEVSEARLAEMMLELQDQGAHNVNLVTATHFVPAVLAALDIAVRQGFRLPLVYNCGGYESLETLRLLDGVVDIYLPDAKYADDEAARRLSGFPDYVAVNRAALREMVRQVGDELAGGLAVDDDGLARRGLIVRHLVLPGGLAGTAEVLRWIARELSPRVPVSLMAQYFPAYRALADQPEDPALGRPITGDEYLAALEAFDAAGLERGWRQEYDGDPDSLFGFEVKYPSCRAKTGENRG
jgi:putative pyruvate formate lyase activating enzyme